MGVDQVRDKMGERAILALAALFSASITLGFTLDVPSGGDLVKVRDEVRAARASGRIRHGEPVTVTLAPGEYRMTGTLVFGKEDSGSAGAPVIWRAEKPGTVKIVSGIMIAPSEFASVADHARLASFSPDVREKIRVADVSKVLPGELKPWPDAYHGMHPGPWLYQDGEPLEIASWPNGKWASFDKVADTGLTDDPKNEFAVRPGAFFLEGAPNAARWNLDEGVWCDGYWKHDWDEEILRLAEYDAAKHIAKPRKIHKWGLLGKGTCGMKERRFKVVNVAAELDAPGEWWLDRKAKKLYLLPVPGREKMPVVLVPAAPTLVALDKAEWMRFENMTFAYSHGTAPGVSLGSESRHIVLSGCRFANFGGVALAVNGRDNVVTGCVVEKTGGSGITLHGGDRKNLIGSGNLIEKSEVTNYGRFSRTALGIIVGGCGNAVRNCEIHHGAAGAIGYGGNEHLFAENDIHHVLLEACDAGATYTGYDTSSQGNLLFGNVVHELGDGDPKLLAHRSAFYFDDCDWGDDVIGNRFFGAGIAILIGGGNMHRIHNNLFVDVRTGVSCGDRGVSWERRLRGSFLPDGDGNSWAESCVMPFAYRKAPWHVAYPEIAALVDDRPNLPHSNPISGNVFQNCGRAFSLGGLAKSLADEMPIVGNIVVTETNAVRLSVAPQPIGFADAARIGVKSPDGRTKAEFFLDTAGRFSWTADYDGARIIDRSSLGVTVGYRDFGKLIVPCAAKFSTAKDAPTDELRDDSDFVHPQKARGYEEAVVPMKDLISGRETATFEIRAFDGGIAFRWRVPGAGVRTVYGEMAAWNVTGGKLLYRRRVQPTKGARWQYLENGPWDDQDGLQVVVCDANRGDMPRFRLQERGPVTGLVFPDYPRGWKTVGEVVTPWRVTLFGNQKEM